MSWASGLWIAGGLVAVASLPYWLPAWVIRLRNALFAKINGQQAVELPGSWGGAAFREVYAHPRAEGRSAGAALSDLFWYWLSPGPEMHQEHIENGPRYRAIAALSRQLLSRPRVELAALLEQAASRCLVKPARGGCLVRLRDWTMPLWAEFYYELVFREACPPAARQLIVDNANDVVTALKCCSLRHMKKRLRLTRYLFAKIRRDGLPFEFPAGFTALEQAYYLQGTFFNTAVVQMSEAMAHLLLAVAQHDAVQRDLAAGADRAYYDHVINETLRLYPLFGVSHRVASDDIALSPDTAGGAVLPKGAVLCFDHAAYQQIGYDAAQQFRPQRWATARAKHANFIPFGVAQNRPCPAQAIALFSMRSVLHWCVSRYELASSVRHVRSLPSRGPCLLVERGVALKPLRRWAVLKFMALRDRWEDVFRSPKQLVLGTIMIWHARRLRLCARYYETAPASAAPPGAAVCPYAHTATAQDHDATGPSGGVK